MERIFQEIWDNWRGNKGFCQDCPVRDKNLFWYPLYGLWNLQADIAIISSDPKYNIEGWYKRNKKNSDADLKQHRDWLPENFKRFEDVKNLLEEERLRNKNKPYIRTLEALVENIRDLKLRDVYATTALKCGSWGNKKANTEALERCSNYLTDELFSVYPRLIVIFGNNSKFGIRNALVDAITDDEYVLLGFEDRLSKAEIEQVNSAIEKLHIKGIKELHNGDCIETPLFKIRPFVHWSRGDCHISNYRLDVQKKFIKAYRSIK